MVAKEFNAALSDEKIREQWLKRFLPGLALTVVYFVFVSSNLTEKANKAEDAHKQLEMKGISEAVLPGMEQESLFLQDQVNALKQKDAEVQASLAVKAGFLYGQKDANQFNQAVGRIAQIMEAHHLRITEEAGAGEKKVADLPLSFADLKNWLGEMLQLGEAVHVHRIRFVGSYLDTYQALKEMALGDVRALPLYLTMKNVDKNPDQNVGLKDWILELWL